jgi:signal transduction histidine kinase
MLGLMAYVAVSPENGITLTAALEPLIALVDESGVGPTLSREARDSARTNALALSEAFGESSETFGLVMLGYAAELLCAIAVDLAANPKHAQRLIDQLEAQAGVPRAALGREVLRTGRLLELPVDIAIEVQLSLLLAFTGAESISLWTLAAGGELEHISHTGELDRSSTSTQAAARALLEADGRRAPRRATTLGLRIDSLQQPAALIAQGIDPSSAVHGLLLVAAAPILTALLNHEALLAREHSQESVISAVERRLARLRFDLHDGPQQDVHLLAQDLRLFRDQLRPMIAGDPNHGRVLGRLDDLEAQLVALDGSLRSLSTTVQSPFLSPGSLREALAQLTAAFAARTGVVPETKLTGTSGQMTDSQQITLLSLIREALSNIRKHSDAHSVTIEIASGERGLEVKVIDDGRGFHPEATLVTAARAGHLGLVGMHERVRMLGGSTQIDSKPGGPTLISATLPRWPPDRERSANRPHPPALGDSPRVPLARCRAL